MTALVLKRRNTFGEQTTYTVFDKDWLDGRYILGFVSEQDSVWKPYCFARKDIGWVATSCPTFQDRDSALAWVKRNYTEALAVYEERRIEILRLIHDGGLSPIKVIDARHPDSKVLVTVIDTQDTCQKGVYISGTKQFELTIQEALTALDYLYARSSHRYVVRIDGLRTDGQRIVDGFAEWTVPYGSNDYHLCGRRSLAGRGRSSWCGLELAA